MHKPVSVDQASRAAEANQQHIAPCPTCGTDVRFSVLDAYGVDDGLIYPLECGHSARQVGAFSALTFEPAAASAPDFDLSLED